MAPGRAHGRWRSFLALALAGHLLLLIAGELLARARWSAPWHERLVSEQVRARPAIEKNSWRMRDREYAVPRPDGVLRMMIVGASCVMGSGVREDELVFPELIEAELNETAWPGSPGGVEVLNAGRAGSFPRNWLWTWSRFGADFDPDLLVIACFLRDGTLTGTGNGFFDRVRRQVEERDRSSLLYQHSYLWRALSDWNDRRRIAATLTEALHQGYFGDEEQTAHWRESREHLRELVERARAHGTRVALAVLPILVELDSSYPFQAEVDLFVELGRTLELPTCDLLPALRGHRGPELWVSPLDQHPNPRAHALIARALLPFVRDELRAAVAQETQ